MSGSLLIKMCIEPTQVSVEDLIRREFGDSLILYYAEVLNLRANASCSKQNLTARMNWPRNSRGTSRLAA